MKFSIDVQSFREAAIKTLSVVDKKNSRPILTNCFIRTSHEGIEVIATDLEVSTKLFVPANIENPGGFCINSKSLSDILRELPDERIECLIEDSNSLKIICNNIDYSLLISQSEDYPHLTFNEVDDFKMKSADIVEMISKTSHAISTDETRLYLNGIFLQEANQKLRAVAIDGHRLALLDVNEFIGSNKNLVDGVIIPRKGINELKKICEADLSSEISLSLDESFLYVSNKENYNLSIRLIAREYPKYQTVIPAKTSYDFTIAKTTLINAVKRIKILSNEKTNGIKFILNENKLTISSSHPSLGKASEVIEIDYHGQDLEIGFNAKYIIDTLSVFDNEDIKLEFNNELSPVVIKSEKLPDFLGIIMPLKL